MRKKGHRIYNKWYKELAWWFIEQNERGKWTYFIAGMIWSAVLFIGALLVVKLNH